MQISMVNQKGEIVTIAIVATFIILSIATIAASVITQNPRQSFNSSSRAADSCQKGQPKGHYCETQADGFGTPPYCVRVDWGQSCEDVYVRDDSIQGCCTQPTAPAGGRACDSKNPRATFCGVDACNGDKGGDPLHCPVCNGGWCNGGYCSTCGNQPAPTAPPSQNQPPAGGGGTGGQCSGTVYAPPSGGQQPNCSQFNGRVKIENNYWNTNCGHICTGDGECAVNGAPGWCYGFGDSDGKKCMSLGGSATGCQVQQVSSSTGGGSSSGNIPVPPAGGGGSGGGGSTGGNPQPTQKPSSGSTTAKTCQLRLYFQDIQTSQNLKDVEFTITNAQGLIESGTGSRTGYYSGGKPYESGDVSIVGKKSGYANVRTVRLLTAPGNNGICEETVKMIKSTPNFTCPQGETTDSTCGGSTQCPLSQNNCSISTQDPASGTTCFKCQKICPAPSTPNSNCDGRCSAAQCTIVNAPGRNGASCYTCGSAPVNTTVPTNPAVPTPTPTSIPVPIGIPGQLNEKCIAKTISQSSGQQSYSCDQGFCIKDADGKNPPMCRAFDKLTYFRNGADPNNPDENPPTIVVVKICFYKKGFISGPCEEYGNENTKLVPWSGAVNTTGLNNLCKKYYPADENVEIGVDIAFHADNPHAQTKTKSFSALCRNYYQVEVFGLEW